MAKTTVHIAYQLDKIIDIFNVIVYKICEITDNDSFLHFVEKLEKKFVLSQFKSFFKKRINKNNPCVLIIEINTCHGETLPSVYKYFKSLDFDVDILVNRKQYLTGSLKPIKLEGRDKIFAVTNNVLKKCIESSKIKQYDFVFHNSYQTYINKTCPNIFELHKNLKYPKQKLLGYVHHLDLFDNNTSFHPFALCELNHKIATKDNYINPCYFFNDVKIKQKNKKTNFVMTGNIQNKRRNYDLLFKTVEKLHFEGYKNFKITIIGQGDIKQFPKYLRRYFDIKGWLDYPSMYNNIKKADFFLLLLDPLNIEHERYLKTGTSGNFQLIYGFLKPCLIEEKFAKPHKFNNKNSIIYKSNDGLKNAIIEAGELENDKYITMQEELKKLQKDLFEKSRKNLERAIKNEHFKI